jgi:hypothetical protein
MPDGNAGCEPADATRRSDPLLMSKGTFGPRLDQKGSSWIGLDRSLDRTWIGIG